MRIAASLLIGAGLLTFAFAASAQEPAPTAPPATTAQYMTMPHWLLRPDANDVARVYPSGAYRRVVGGHVVMVCKITADGSMTACSITSETPVGLGFGEAALNLAPDFKMSATKSDGGSVEGATIQIPITFNPPAR